jgi:elongation factor Ts
LSKHEATGKLKINIKFILRKQMSKVDIKLIQELREKTGLGMMDCKKALEENNGDIEKAIEHLRKKGAAVAAKRSDKATSQGTVCSYVHPGDQLGVLVEINCETDFVARTEAFKQFAKDIAMHIAAFKPIAISPEEVDPKLVEKEREVLTAQLAQSGKPANIIAQIVDGRVNKFYAEICLLKQQFMKNDKITVEEEMKQLIAKTGENIKIRRFVRYQVGE